MAFGCGAHGTRHGVRWKNASCTDEYIRRVVEGADPVTERRCMGPDERVEEAMFMGLRLAAGIDIDEVGARYGCDVWARYGPGLRPFLDAGVLRREGARLRLTREGMLLANEVMTVFV